MLSQAKVRVKKKRVYQKNNIHINILNNHSPWERLMPKNLSLTLTQTDEKLNGKKVPAKSESALC